jgi:putative oxidoreductase
MVSILALCGRVLMAALFLLSAFSKIGDYSGTLGYMESRGIPFAPFALFSAALLELIGGLSLLTGYRARTGALLLAVFLVPVTYLFHFKVALGLPVGTPEYKFQMISALKNLAIMGGLLMVFGNGAGKLSLGRDS